MRKFNPGDRVKSNLNADRSFNKVGTVVGYYVNDDTNVLVNFGPDFVGHNGEGGVAFTIPDKYKNYHNWWVKEAKLQLDSSSTTTSKSEPVEPKQTKGESNMTIDFNKLGKDIVSDNIQFAKFEAERKVGHTALDVSIEAFCKQFPSFRETADTSIGKLAIANIIRVLGNQYNGANKDAVDMFTSAVMRGSYATCGDSINLEKMFDGLVEKFKSIIPSGLISETPESK